MLFLNMILCILSCGKKEVKNITDLELKKHLVQVSYWFFFTIFLLYSVPFQYAVLSPFHRKSYPVLFRKPSRTRPKYAWSCITRKIHRSKQLSLSKLAFSSWHRRPTGRNHWNRDGCDGTFRMVSDPNNIFRRTNDDFLLQSSRENACSTSRALSTPRTGGTSTKIFRLI